MHCPKKTAYRSCANSSSRRLFGWEIWTASETILNNRRSQTSNDLGTAAGWKIPGWKCIGYSFFGSSKTRGSIQRFGKGACWLGEGADPDHPAWWDLPIQVREGVWTALGCSAPGGGLNVVRCRPPIGQVRGAWAGPDNTQNLAKKSHNPGGLNFFSLTHLEI